MQAIAVADPVMVVWWGTEVECASAIARLERDGWLDEEDMNQAFDRLKQLADMWHVIDATDAVREAAVRFLRVHPLRAADALQLGVAYLVSERRPSSPERVTPDERLATAARKRVLPSSCLPSDPRTRTEPTQQ